MPLPIPVEEALKKCPQEHPISKTIRGLQELIGEFRFDTILYSYIQIINEKPAPKGNETVFLSLFKAILLTGLNQYLDDNTAEFILGRLNKQYSKEKGQSTLVFTNVETAAKILIQFARVHADTFYEETANIAAENNKINDALALCLKKEKVEQEDIVDSLNILYDNELLSISNIIAVIQDASPKDLTNQLSKLKSTLEQHKIQNVSKTIDTITSHQSAFVARQLILKLAENKLLDDVTVNLVLTHKDLNNNHISALATLKAVGVPLTKNLITQMLTHPQIKEVTDTIAKLQENSISIKRVIGDLLTAKNLDEFTEQLISTQRAISAVNKSSPMKPIIVEFDSRLQSVDSIPPARLSLLLDRSEVEKEIKEEEIKQLSKNHGHFGAAKHLSQNSDCLHDLSILANQSKTQITTKGKIQGHHHLLLNRVNNILNAAHSYAMHRAGNQEQGLQIMRGLLENHNLYEPEVLSALLLGISSGRTEWYANHSGTAIPETFKMHQTLAITEVDPNEAVPYTTALIEKMRQANIATPRYF